MDIRKSSKKDALESPHEDSVVSDQAQVDGLIGAALRANRIVRSDSEVDRIADRIVRVAAEVARSMGAPEKALRRNGSPHRTMSDAIRGLGRTMDSVAEAVGLTRTLLLRLGRGLIDIETIPPRLIDYLSIELDSSVEQVRAWISVPPARPLQASYLSMSVPDSPGRQSFRDAIASERELPDDVMREWLGEEDAAED